MSKPTEYIYILPRSIIGTDKLHIYSVVTSDRWRINVMDMKRCVIEMWTGADNGGKVFFKKKKE